MVRLKFVSLTKGLIIHSHGFAYTTIKLRAHSIKVPLTKGDIIETDPYMGIFIEARKENTSQTKVLVSYHPFPRQHF